MKLLALLALLTIFSLQPSFAKTAFENSYVEVETKTYPLRGLILMNLKNNSDSPITLRVTPTEFHNVKGSEAKAVELAPREEKTETLNLGTIRANQPYLVIDYRVIASSRMDRNVIPVETSPEYFIRNIRDNTYSETTARAYILDQRALFNSRETRVEESTLDLGAGLSVPSTLDVRAFFPVIPTPEESRIEIEPIEAPSTRVLAESLRIAQLPSKITVNQQVVVPFKPGEETHFLSIEKDNKADCTKLKCFSGQLVMIPSGLKPKVPAAWGYTVELWENGLFGFKKVATTETGFMGLWSAAVDSNISNQVTVIYKPINRFVQIINPATNMPYQFAEHIEAGKFQKSVFKGDVEWHSNRIFHFANKLWLRLAKGGINPISPFLSYRIVYPNAMKVFGGAQTPCTYEVKKGSFIPWSCSTGGTIYLIPTHANEHTVAHELAHEIHRLFWKKFPAGSGGDHMLWGCYNPGLAVVEGFANFLGIWLRGDSIDAKSAPVFAGRDAETFHSGCPTDNEFDVAATFWDLYDTQNETRSESEKDNVTYYSDTNVIADFLGAGVQSGMPDYRMWLAKKHPESDSINFLTLFMLNNSAF